MRTLSVVQEFALRSLLFVSVMAVTLGVLISWSVHQVFITESARTARIAASTIVQEHVSLVELDNRTLSAESTQRLDDVVARDLREVGVSVIRLWNRQGVLVYASDDQKVGRSFVRVQPLRRALEGRVQVDVNDAQGRAPALPLGGGATIEVFAPLGRAKGMPVGALSISQPYAPIRNASRKIILYLWMIILAGSVPAYFMQLGIVRRTVRELHLTRGDLSNVNRRLSESLDNLEMHSVGTMQALVSAVDAKDSYTARHSMAVTDYALAIGRRMGLEEEKLADLERAGLLHDVGKIGTPEVVLLKPAGLTDEEFLTIKGHPAMSGHIVETVPFIAHLMPVVRAHHERWDGGGYPDGLLGERIPLLARILTVADAFDAMTSDRPYRAPVSVEMARAELLRCTGSQFDPAAVWGMLAALDSGEAKVFVHAESKHRYMASA